MWDGPGPGPGPGPRRRGGPHFRDHHEDYGGRDHHPMHDRRGRGGMNIGPMGPMGQRHFDMPPMDMRRMDGPPMRGHDMDPRNMGGSRERDFFKRGEDSDFAPGREVQINFKEKFVYNPDFDEHRHPDDMDGRNMPPHDHGSMDKEQFEFERRPFHSEGRRGFPMDRMNRDPEGRFMDMDRDGFEFERVPFHSEGRRGFPMDRMDRNDRFRGQRERSPMNMRHSEGFDMDMPPHDRRMDMNRPGGSPFNPRGGFGSDIDLRNQPGPGSNSRGRGRTPSKFKNDQSDVAQDDNDPQTTEEAAPGHDGDSPLMDYRCGEEMTLAEEWKNRNKGKKPFVEPPKGFGDMNESNYPMDFGRDENIRDLHSKERDAMSADYPAKDLNFPLRNRFPNMDLPIGTGPPDFVPPLNDPHARERENKPWLKKRDLEYRQPPPNLVKTPSPQELHKPPDGFKDVSQPQREKPDEKLNLGSSSAPPRDQDYRDIDYRTASRGFDFKPELLPTPLKFESETSAPDRFIESASQDQDYRGAVFQDPVSTTVSITGIPKTATMEQILGAFTSPDGVPLQGMKIKTIVPGYSYDTAIVEFLNREDAVHIMESNKASLKIGSSLASMKFVRPEDCDRGTQESDHGFPHDPESHRAGAPPEELKSALINPVPGLAVDGSSTEWMRNSDLTPEAWQRQVDQQLQQPEDTPREPWSSQQPPPQHPGQTDYSESKTLIIKYVKPTTTVETILKTLDPYAYLDERSVRIVKAKTGNKCFCFVDMESHEQVKRLVDLLSKLKPMYIDGFRIYVEIAKPLKNTPQSAPTWTPPGQQQQQQQFMPPPQYMPPMPPPVTAPSDMQGGLLPVTPNLSLPINPGITQSLGYGGVPGKAPTEPVVAESQQPVYYITETPDVSNYLFDATSGFFYDPETTLYYDPNSRYFYNAETQIYLYWDPALKAYIPVPGSQSADGLTMGDQAILSNPAADAPLEMKKAPANPHIAQIPIVAVNPPAPQIPQTIHASYTAETPHSSFSIETKQASFNKAKPSPHVPHVPLVPHVPHVPHVPLVPHVPHVPHVPLVPHVPPVPPVPVPPVPVPVPAPDTAAGPIEPAPASTAPLEPIPAAEPAIPPQDFKDDEEAQKDKDDKPKSRAAVKIMKDMERWAKIQNRQKDSVRTPSSNLREDGRRQSKSADAGFAVFERKITGGSEELFKMPFAPKKDEKSKRSMGSLGALVSDYGAGSDEDVEEDREEPKASKAASPAEKEDRLTDWKKMACLLCRRQFPNKDALVRHQSLSDLHKQNMKLHLKIKKSKKELEALEKQEQQLKAQATTNPPEPRKRKPRSPPSPPSPPLPTPPPKPQRQPQPQRDWAESERPGLGAEPIAPQKKKKKVYTHAAYKQAVRNAMFARYKELDACSSTLPK